MTYSFTEKEEILYERQIDELFNLTEWGISDVKKEPFVDATGKVWNVTAAQARRLKLADKTAHYTDQYARPIRSALPGGITPDSDPEDKEDKGEDWKTQEFDPPEVPVILPTIPRNVKKKVVPKKVAPTIPKRLDGPKKVAPTTPKRLSGPERFAPTKPKLLGKLDKVAPQKVIPHKVPQKVISTKPLSPNNQKAAKIAQEEIDRIIKKLQNNKTTLKQGTKLLTQLGKLEQLKPLRLNIPKAQIPPRFSLPAPDGSKVTVPKVTIPEPPKVTVPTSGAVDPNAEFNRTQTNAQAQRQAEEALAFRQKQAAEKARLANIAKKAEEAALAKQAAQQREVPKSPEKQNIEQDIDTKQKAKVEADKLKAKVEADRLKAQAVKEPIPQSKMAKGMVQPKEGQGIKSFAKQLGYNTVEEFEKANPKGVGIDKKTGNKFVKTGVSYIDQQAFGVANELDNAKRLLNKAQNAKKLNPARIAKLEKQVASLEADINGTKGKSPTVIDRKNVMAKGPLLKDLRPKWNLGRNVDMAKMRGKLAVGFGKKVAGKLASKAAYAIPVLNVVVIAYDIHELMVGTAGGAGNDVTTQSRYRQNDLRRMDAIVNSEASIEEKRKALEGLGTNGDIFNDVEGDRKWEKETHNWEEHQIDPPMPFVDDNENALDPFKMSLKQMKKFIPQQVASGPYTQRDIEYIIQRTMKKREYELGPSRKKVNNVPAYLKNYQAKIALLKSIKNSIPETNRVDAYKKVFAMAIDVQEAHIQAGGTVAFKHNALETALEFASTEGIIKRDEYYAELKRKKEEPGIWQKGYDAVTDFFTGDDDDKTALAGMSVKPTLSQNNDPEVVTTVGTPYGNDPGAPANFREYETLMKQVSLGFDLPIAVVRALAMQESGMHVTNKGQLSPWSYTGDHTLGKKGAFGPFHVRSDPDKGASLEHFNEVKGTTYTWKDLATNPMLAAAVGATYFKHWYDKTGGDAQKAYELYNGGPSGYMKTQSIANAKKFKERLDKFNESRNFANKSAILEGIAIAA